MKNVSVIHTIPMYSHAWDHIHGNMWDPENLPGEDEFEIEPKNVIFNELSHYNYVIHGPTGGGKTSAAVTICIYNGFFRGKRVFSTVPISFYIYDIYNNKYEVQSEEFDVVKFVNGDDQYRNSFILLDEANFNLDSKRAMSALNISIVDIMQEGRKLDMSCILTVLNPGWLEGRILSTLADIKIECHDLFFTEWGRLNNAKKGHVVSWKVTDISGKYTGHQWADMGTRPVLNWRIFGTFNTKFFIKPSEQRKRISFQRESIYVDTDGNRYDPHAIDNERLDLARQLARTQTEWPASDLWETLALKTRADIIRTGAILLENGASKRQGTHERIYNLTGLLE